MRVRTMGLGGVVLVVVVCTAALLTACGGSAGATIKVTEVDNNKTVTAKVGDKLSVTLKENPTTGYEWNMIAGPGLAVVSDKFAGPEPSPSPLMGAGGTHTWVYAVHQAGTMTLTGVYARSWESQSKSAADFSLTVDATE
ncbi:MAG: protease inhibitor I42 family protein [Actinobacteria bacterium]|nr:protease inhibitor I42 family protein [Actinomycetota bacterium]